MNLALLKTNIKGISRLRHLTKEYYNKILTYHTTTSMNKTATNSAPKNGIRTMDN